MSYTEIYHLWPGTNQIESEMGLQNSHGSAPHVWGKMCIKYLDRPNENDWLFKSAEIWPLVKDPRVSKTDRVVLALTFDGAYIAKKDYKTAAQDIRGFFERYPIKKEYVNHWPTIIKHLESDPDCPAIGFYWTSCGDDFWELPTNDEGEEEGDFNWSNAFDVYEEYAKEKEGQHV